MPFPFPGSWNEDFTGFQGEPLSEEEIKRFHLDEVGKIWGEALAIEIDKSILKVLEEEVK